MALERGIGITGEHGGALHLVGAKGAGAGGANGERNRFASSGDG